MFRKLLIANRGEIALRVIRACRELGVRSVAVFSKPDAHSLHVRFADEAICIGPADVRKSYLNIPNIITAAQISGVDAIHPGYGFLAENAYFADICEECSIKFIGPSSDVIRLMGDKSRARETMRNAGIPIIPGDDRSNLSESELKQAADTIGYPLIIKASGGGGGRGMRVVESPEFLTKAYRQATSEAESTFGDSRVYIERYLINARHVEFQILGDSLGNIIHLGERDCSIQRRHQKLIEESPCPVMHDELRKKMGTTAVQAAQTVNYQNAGTIEFLLMPSGEYFFIEMNTRIQVEHPVTEEVTGINLLKEQIRIAAGEPLKRRTSMEQLQQHAIECRINAEDPMTFSPVPGEITTCNFPGGLGIRVDTVIYPHYKVLPFYDSMLAKLVIRAEDREEALARMARALDEFVIEGIPTTLPFHRRILKHPEFRSGQYHTHSLLSWSKRHIG